MKFLYFIVCLAFMSDVSCEVPKTEEGNIQFSVYDYALLMKMLLLLSMFILCFILVGICNRGIEFCIKNEFCNKNPRCSCCQQLPLYNNME